MHFKNTVKEYGMNARAFHWVMALLMIGLLGLGFFMDHLKPDPFKFELYGLHKSFGILVLFLVLLRVSWRFISVVPEGLSTHAKWERFLAVTIHIVLYICMIGMPLSGWVMSSSGGHDVSVFGLFNMPEIIGENKEVSGLSKTAHKLFAYGLLGAVALHILGALKHHILDGDSTLRRMGGTWYIAGPMVALFAFCAALVVSLLMGSESVSDVILSLLSK